MTPQYTASGGVVFVKEHEPITIHHARVIENIHRMNAAHQLGQICDHTRALRLALAKTETDLADEMAAAIRQATQ